MKRRLIWLMRHRPSPAMVVALVALFLALGGVGYAKFALPANSVSSREVKDRSLLAKDFRRGQLPRGEKGERGEPGPQGPVGAPGAPASLHTQFVQRSEPIAPDQTKIVWATCPAGTRLVSGGFRTDPPVEVVVSEPIGVGIFGPPENSWVVVAHHPPGQVDTGLSIEAAAICTS